MPGFVKPNSIVKDPRAEEEKDRELYERSQINLHHLNKQLVAHGHSMEELVSAVAKQVYGINIVPHAPEPKE